MKNYIGRCINDKRQALLFILVLISGNALAHPNCAGQVTEVGVNPAGYIYASIVNTSKSTNFVQVKICNVTAAAGEWLPESCKATFSLLTTAQATGKTVRLWFYEDKFVSCTKSWKAVYTDGLYFLRIE